MERYILVDHTADIMVRAFGNTLEECFANAGYALFDQTVDLSGVRTSKKTEFRVTGIDDEDRLYSFLSELLFLEDCDNLILREIEVSFDGDDAVCRGKGETLDRSRHRIKSEVKAVTYHMMEIDKDTPSVTVIFDVRASNNLITKEALSLDMLKLGWFSTGRGLGSRNLLKAVMDKKEQRKLDIEISFVFCNWDNDEEDNPRREQRQMFFDMVAGYGIPLVTLSWKMFMPELWKKNQTAWRDEYGKELRRLTSAYPFDLGILAGYMLWMDDETCREYDMLNLHPALPDGPKGTWQEVIWQLISEDAERQGVMIHICTEEWDRGAAITYCGFPIRGNDYDALWDKMHKKLGTRTLEQIKAEEGQEEPLFKRIREDGVRRELPLIVATIGAFADGRVRIVDKKLYAGDKMLDGPYDLSEQVDGALE